MNIINCPGLRAVNETKVRLCQNSNSKRPYVVERFQNRIEHRYGNHVRFVSYIIVHVGRYASEMQANHAAITSAKKHGGFAHSRTGCIGVYAKGAKP